MKKSILIFLFLNIGFVAFAQKQANIWYFGTNVGLDFNQTPPATLNNGIANSQEGSATISDHNGNLLFYTNGVIIANRKHTVMKNGTGLLGDLSSTDNALVVPSPGNDSIYYLFTIGSVYQLNKGLRYSIINMRGDAGFGEVIDKNIIVEPSTFEKVGAVKHCNKRDVWIVIHKWNTDEYHAYLVTASGVSTTPVISHTGFFITTVEDNSIGKLKFSADGKQLAAVHAYGNSVVELMDFNNATGQLTNPIFFRPGPVSSPLNVTGVYAAEFSPNGNLLYVSDNPQFDGGSNLYQFDISSHNAAIILASKQIIASPDPWFSGALQIGPDNKIYMALPGNTYLSVIQNPDVYGAGCNFRQNEIFMGQTNSRPVQYGLPNFIQSYFNPQSNPYEFSQSRNCTDRNVTFKISRLSGIDSVKWDFGDTQQSQVLQPTNNYASPGLYDVKLIVYKIDCSGLNDTIIRKIWIADTNEFLGADTSSCNALSLEIGSEEIFGAFYLWNTGSGSNKITISGFGDYWLEIDQNGCKLRDTIKVTPRPKPLVNLGVDTGICKYKPVILTTGSSVFDSYLWSTGATTPSISVNQTGSYYVTVTKSACEASDTIQVLTGDCDVYIPSAFTPNYDNLNETFGVVENTTLQFFSLQIYSKWGQLIFSSNDVTKKWDGTFKGKKMPNGSYLWMLNYTNIRGRKFYEQGSVMLIR